MVDASYDLVVRPTFWKPPANISPFTGQKPPIVGLRQFFYQTWMVHPSYDPVVRPTFWNAHFPF